MNYVTNSEVTNALSEFAQQGPNGAELRLADITSFQWDAVYFFMEGTMKADVNKKIGSTLFKNQDGRLMERGPLVVFMRQGLVAHAVVVLPPLFVSGTNGNCYTRQTAVLVAHTKDPGPYLLRFRSE